MRDRILDATERLMGRLGYQKMTMDDIAREAGIGRRTIYLHFPSKEETALATIDRIVDRLKTGSGELAASSLPWDERLRRMLLVRRAVPLRQRARLLPQHRRDLPVAPAGLHGTAGPLFRRGGGDLRRGSGAAAAPPASSSSTIPTPTAATLLLATNRPASLEPEHPRAGRAGGGRGPRRAHRRSAADGPVRRDPRGEVAGSSRPTRATDTRRGVEDDAVRLRPLDRDPSRCFRSTT